MESQVVVCMRRLISLIARRLCCGALRGCTFRFVTVCGVQGYLTYKNPPPLGPYRRLVPRVLGGPMGLGVFLWARYPCRGRMENDKWSGRVAWCDDTLQGYLAHTKHAPSRTLR